MLTGESLPVDKVAAATDERPIETGPEARHLVFLGTSVVGGTATAAVTATGPKNGVCAPCKSTAVSQPPKIRHPVGTIPH
jgi:Mg2+-importing ATPase